MRQHKSDLAILIRQRYQQGMDVQPHKNMSSAARIDSALKGSNQSGLRAHNERLVLSLIRQNGPLAKSKITRMTGLSAQTVSVIMRALEADGLLKKEKPVRGGVGQPSVPMDLRADAAFFFGLKVGRRSLDLILVDFLGQERGRLHLTHHYPDPDQVVRFAHEAISELLDQLSPSERARVAGLGIAIPFRLWDWADALKVSQSQMDKWRHRDVAAEIAQGWDFPVYLQNDASAACGAELVFGHRDNPPDFLYFFVGFFIGGGLVLDNRLYTGRTGNAAALGPMPVAGEHQLIDRASLVILERQLEAAGSRSGMIWEGAESWSVPEDILASWTEAAAKGLAYAIISSACLIDVTSVVIDGWLPLPIRAKLVAQTRKFLDELIPAGIDIPRIREGCIGHDARALGAASLPLSDRFLIDKNTFLKGN